MGRFGLSVAKNWGGLATLMTIWRVKFRPSLMIFWHLEVWPGPPLALRLILKFPNFSLKISKTRVFDVKKNFVSDFDETQNLKSLWPRDVKF